ncbi:MAG: sulfotransferase domain-containing protein [Pseudomonadota bacterium]
MSRIAQSIVWLASYPKSGNTWLRAFMANYLVGGDVPIPLNDLGRIGFGDSSLQAYRDIAGRDPNLMPIPELLGVRRKVLEEIADNGADINLVKTHHAKSRIRGHWLIPADLTRTAIYLVRNPLDMVVSYADHWGTTQEFAARHIALPTNGVPASKKTVSQYLGNWSEHVRSWAKSENFRTLILRYEDLLADPEGSFTKAVRHIGAPVEEATIRQAIAFSSFDALSEQESTTGFSERGPKQERFFRRGQSGSWQDELAPELADKIRKDHGAVMEEYGYL